MAEKYQWFDGKKFTRDDKAGYYLNSTIHKRMHIYVWEFYNGKVPKGCEIHHIDFDKSNNDISNLQLLTISEHRKLHSDLLIDEQRASKRENFNTNARPKAIEWHKSEDGRLWHKQQYEITKNALHKIVEKQCIQCGKTFSGEIKCKFCSNACKSAYRRTQGLNNVIRICVICGNEFATDKYKHSVTCSRKCAAKYRQGVKNESKTSN